jgi:membrane fusion protein, multidrug efflux system
MTEQFPKEKFERLADPVASPEHAATRAPEPAPPSRKKRRAALPIIVLLLLVAGGWYGYRYLTDWRFLVATDDAYVKADMAILSAKISGNLVAVPVVENQSVKAGDVLAEIDPGDYKLAVASAQGRIDTQTATIARIRAQEAGLTSSVAQVRAQQTASVADQVRAASEFERAQALVERKFATPQRLDLARADRDRTSAAVAGADAALAAAEANLAVMRAQREEAERVRDELRIALDRAKRDLDFATVRAPFDGVVGNKAAQLGAFVAPGTRLMALVPLDTAYVEANFKETQLGRIKSGQKASILVDAYANRHIEGTVDSVAPASGAQFSLLPPENATGNFTKIVQRVPVRVRLPADVARAGNLRPGLSVVVDIDTRTGDTAAH